MRAFVDSAAEAFQLRGPVYQIGFFSGGDSDIGLQSSFRESFSEAAYVGFELDPEAPLGRLPFPDGSARTVLCAGGLNSVLRSHGAAAEMARVLSPGGALLVCASADALPPDRLPGCWRSTPNSVQRLLAGTAATVVGWQGAETFPHTMYGVGFKPPLPAVVLEGTMRFLDRFQARLDQRAGRVGWRRLKRLVTGWAKSRSRRRYWRDYYRLQLAVHLRVDANWKHVFLPDSSASSSTGARLDLIN